MSTTIAFDVYGTLIDPFGITDTLTGMVGDSAPEVARLWRDKQIEYLFRRALMRQYQTFAVCTADALDYSCRKLNVKISAENRQALLAQYRKLPAFPEVAASIKALREHGVRMFAFSNGEPNELRELLANAGVADMLDGIVSVHDVRSFKPDPLVYRHFLEAAGSDAASTWLVSGNPFDLVGSAACGWRTAWVRRDPAQPFDTWGQNPDETVADIGELTGVFPSET